MNISESVYGSGEWVADIIADAAVDFFNKTNPDAQMECNVALRGDVAFLFGNATQRLPLDFFESEEMRAMNCKLHNHIAKVQSLDRKLYVASGYSTDGLLYMPIADNLTQWSVEALRDSGSFPEARCRIISELDRCQIDVRHPGMSLEDARELVFELVTSSNTIVGPEVNAGGAWDGDWRSQSSPPVKFSRQRTFLSGHTSPAIGRSWNHPERIASSLARAICVSMAAIGRRESKAMVGINSASQIEFIELFTREESEWDQYILTTPDLDIEDISSKLCFVNYSHAAEFGYYGNDQHPWEHPWDYFYKILESQL